VYRSVRFRSIVVTAFAIVLVAPVAAQRRLTREQPIPHAELEAFVDGVVRQGMEDHHVAGVTVAVVQDGQTVLEKGYGFADIERGRRVDPHRTLFRIGSITKTFTWISVMKAVEGGRLRLDDPVNDHLPRDLRIPDQGYEEPVRVRHLMTHSPGFEDLVLGHLFERDPAQVRPLRRYLREERPARVREAGTVSSYSNYGVGLAGAILEQLHGRSWQEIAETEILQPLSLTHTTTREPYPPRDDLPAPMPRELAALLAKGYRWTQGGHVERDFEFITFGAPAGVISSTAGDMTRYMRMLLNDGTLDDVRIFGPQAAQAFRTPLTSLPPEVGNWDAGFWETRLPGGFRNFGHDGGTLSFFTSMVLAPELRLGIFAAANTEGGGALTGIVAPRIVEHFYAPPAGVRSVGSPAVAAAAEEYAGIYLPTRRAYHSLEGFLLRLVRATPVSVTPDGYLLATLDGPRRLVPSATPDTFMTVDGAPFAVKVQRENGRVVRFDALAMAFERVSPLHDQFLLIATFLLAVVSSAGTLLGVRMHAVRDQQVTPLERWATRVQVAAAAAWLAAAAAAVTFVADIAGDPMEIVFTWPTLSIVLFSAGALTASMFSVVALGFVPAIWIQRRTANTWSRRRAVRFTAAALLFAVLGGLLAMWGALTPWNT
jgi:CubicO group peptidase (beta-lactamase class C family)